MRIKTASPESIQQESGYDHIRENQQHLKRQVQAIELLEAEFLRFLWHDQPAGLEQLKERFDHLSEALDQAGGLDPSIALALFDKLEQRAFSEIRKSLALAQTIDPEYIAQQCPDLPKVLITNAQAVHTHAYKTSHSKQASGAAQQKRPAGRHPKRQVVEQLLQQWIEHGTFIKNRRGDQQKFIDHVVEIISGIPQEKTLRKWISDFTQDF